MLFCTSSSLPLYGRPAMILAEYALPTPGSASSSSAVGQVISSSSAFGAGAIFDSEAFGAGAILLSDLAAGCAVWAIDGVAVMRPRVSAVARREASVK